MNRSHLAEARVLVAASLRAQSLRAGLWQQWHDLLWWQSGLQAIGANLVVDVGELWSEARLVALAQLMARAAAPAGWLLWPDQQPLGQQAILQAQGFAPCERLWLGLARPQLDPAWIDDSPSAVSLQVLNSNHTDALTALYGRCHGVPQDVAQLVAETFLAPQSGEVSGGALNFRCFAALAPVGAGGAPLPVAAVTACWQPHGLGCGSLLWLGTDPPWRRQGLARSLTRWACHWLADWGVQRVHVQAAAPAVGLYRLLGFEHQGWLELWGCPA